MSIIAIIPARGGSTRIPRKNIKTFHGRPIIAYSIEKAQKSGLFDRIIVSTEDSEIAAIAQALGAEVWTRNPDFSRNEIGTQEVARESIIGLGLAPTDIVCCIYATAPLMAIGDLCHGYRVLVNNDNARYVFSVGANPLCDAGQFYWGYALEFMLRTPLISTKTRMLPISDRRVCDINTMDDWAMAEKLYERIVQSE